MESICNNIMRNVSVYMWASVSVFIFGGADEGDEKFGFFTEFKFELN